MGEFTNGEAHNRFELVGVHTPLAPEHTTSCCQETDSLLHVALNCAKPFAGGTEEEMEYVERKGTSLEVAPPLPSICANTPEEKITPKNTKIRNLTPSARAMPFTRKEAIKGLFFASRSKGL